MENKWIEKTNWEKKSDEKNEEIQSQIAYVVSKANLCLTIVFSH